MLFATKSKLEKTISKEGWKCITCAAFMFVSQARVERMEEFQAKGGDLGKALSECRRKLADTQKKIQELTISASDDAKADLSKVQAEEKKLKKEEREWEKKLDSHNREEKKMPWNVDTLSKDGFSKVRQISGVLKALQVSHYHLHSLYYQAVCSAFPFLHISLKMSSYLLSFLFKGKWGPKRVSKMPPSHNRVQQAHILPYKYYSTVVWLAYHWKYHSYLTVSWHLLC